MIKSFIILLNKGELGLVLKSLLLSLVFIQYISNIGMETWNEGGLGSLCNIISFKGMASCRNLSCKDVY